MSTSLEAPLAPTAPPPRPFRAAVFRGLGGLLPPLLTVVLIFALLGMLREYVFLPVESGANWVIATWLAQSIVPEDETEEAPDDLKYKDGQFYKRASDGHYVPDYVFATVQQHETQDVESLTSWQLCQKYVEHVILRPHVVIPAIVALFILAMYFLGKLLSRRLVQFVWGRFERMIRKVPLIRNVYSSAQQVTTFLLARHNLRDGEVVAVEYPREQMWTLGYVTGEGLRDVSEASGEPVVSVLMDTSPVPFNGFTCMVPRSKLVKLNLTMDQALQYVISCGVITPGSKPPASAPPASQ
jgi:uncharacterized membrane protein